MQIRIPRQTQCHDFPAQTPPHFSLVVSHVGFHEIPMLLAYVRTNTNSVQQITPRHWSPKSASVSMHVQLQLDVDVSLNCYSRGRTE